MKNMKKYKFSWTFCACANLKQKINEWMRTSQIYFISLYWIYGMAVGCMNMNDWTEMLVCWEGSNFCQRWKPDQREITEWLMKPDDATEKRKNKRREDWKNGRICDLHIFVYFERSVLFPLKSTILKIHYTFLQKYFCDSRQNK